MTPNDISHRPSRMASAGMIVCIGRLPGAEVVGMTGIDDEAGAAVVQHDAGLLGAMPTPNALNSELINDTAMRSRSTTVR